MNLISKEYSFGDEYKIIQLFNEVFGKKMELKYWNWRYKKSEQVYINTMWDDEELVGHYALFPIEVIYKNRAIKTGFSMTTMTSNRYKKLGIFKTLAENLYLSAFNDLKIIWGFPNNNSLHGFVKYLNWRHVFDINMLTIDLIITKIQSDSKNIFEINEFSSEYNNLFSKVIDKYDFIVKRDENYLNWRFVDNPLNRYYILEYKEQNVLKGYCVYKMYRDNQIYCGDIVDILALNEVVFKELVFQAILRIQKKQALYANIWMIDKEFKSILYEIGFINSNNITHFGVCKNNNIESIREIQNLDINNYYLTMADSDVF